jgi:hypothetical protein
MQEYHAASIEKKNAQCHQIPPNEPIYGDRRARGLQGVFKADAIADLRGVLRASRVKGYN